MAEGKKSRLAAEVGWGWGGATGRLRPRRPGSRRGGATWRRPGGGRAHGESGPFEGAGPRGVRRPRSRDWVRLFLGARSPGSRRGRGHTEEAGLEAGLVAGAGQDGCSGPGGQALRGGGAIRRRPGSWGGGPTWRRLGSRRGRGHMEEAGLTAKAGPGGGGWAGAGWGRGTRRRPGSRQGRGQAEEAGAGAWPQGGGRARREGRGQAEEGLRSPPRPPATPRSRSWSGRSGPAKEGCQREVQVHSC